MLDEPNNVIVTHDYLGYTISKNKNSTKASWLICLLGSDAIIDRALKLPKAKAMVRHLAKNAAARTNEWATLRKSAPLRPSMRTSAAPPHARSRPKSLPGRTPQRRAQ